MDPTSTMPHSSCPMNSGDLANSYAQNSSYQRRVIEGAKGLIFQEIPKKLDINHPSFNSTNCFRIADFGCSTGPNTLIAMQHIVEAVMLKYQSISMQEETMNTPHNTTTTIPEFHVFFNDHVDNDFNTLFKKLTLSTWPYFAAGVPGSFYSRLFPAASLHIVYSSFALQWLSKAPPEVADKGSPAWNKGKIYCAGNKKEVTEAYFGQFKADMGTFLKARAQELVEGGLMVIQMPCLPDGETLPSQIIPGLSNELLGDTLADMVNMGVISEEKMDSFNTPMYFATMEEVKMVIAMNKCFTIEHICTLSHPRNSDSRPFDVEKNCAAFRAVWDNLIGTHFGSENMDQLFHILAQKSQQNRLVYGKDIREDVYLFALLKRSGN